MNQQQQIHFERVRQALQYIRLHFKEQPNLETIAQQVHLSPFHFQRLFTEWAGVSPKKFLQYTSLTYAKSLLKKTQAALFDTAQESGLSGSGRLHDLFITLEGMTPGEYKNGGAGLNIAYSFYDSPFGTVLAASTLKGICYTAFTDAPEKELGALKAEFPNAVFNERKNELQAAALQIFEQNPHDLVQIKLHLKGTAFQLKVWEALLKIPFGQLRNYKSIAETIQQPNASRAVGTAIGSNPVSFLIPCHRVIQADGHFGNYRWDPDRKTAIIGWEAALSEPKTV